MKSYTENELKQKKMQNKITTKRNRTADIILATDRCTTTPTGHSEAVQSRVL